MSERAMLIAAVIAAEAQDEDRGPLAEHEVVIALNELFDALLETPRGVLVLMESDAAYLEGRESGLARQVAAVRVRWYRALREYLASDAETVGDAVSKDVVKAELTRAVASVVAGNAATD